MENNTSHNLNENFHPENEDIYFNSKIQKKTPKSNNPYSENSIISFGNLEMGKKF